MVDITENIAADIDDVYTIINTLNAAATNVAVGIYSGTAVRFWGGVRFRTIAVPQGATIDLANLIVQSDAVIGAPSLTIYADDVDDAALWSTTSRVKNITKTTASAAWSPASGSNTIAVTSLLQEIVDRGGFVEDNDVRFGIFGTQTGANWAIFDDYAQVAGTPAVLEIDFTVSGGLFVNQAGLGGLAGTGGLAGVGGGLVG